MQVPAAFLYDISMAVAAPYGTISPKLRLLLLWLNRVHWRMQTFAALNDVVASKRHGITVLHSQCRNTTMRLYLLCLDACACIRQTNRLSVQVVFKSHTWHPVFHKYQESCVLHVHVNRISIKVSGILSGILWKYQESSVLHVYVNRILFCKYVNRSTRAPCFCHARLLVKIVIKTHARPATLRFAGLRQQEQFPLYHA